MTKQARTLEGLKAQHDLAVAHVHPDTAASNRLRARKLCRAQGITVPEWAALQPSVRSSSPVGEATPWRTPQAPSNTPAGPAAFIPPELSAFRARHPGSVVHVRDGAVAIFIAIGEPPIRFASVHAAVQALAATV